MKNVVVISLINCRPEFDLQTWVKELPHTLYAYYKYIQDNSEGN